MEDVLRQMIRWTEQNVCEVQHYYLFIQFVSETTGKNASYLIFVVVVIQVSVDRLKPAFIDAWTVHISSPAPCCILFVLKKIFNDSHTYLHIAIVMPRWSIFPDVHNHRIEIVRQPGLTTLSQMVMQVELFRKLNILERRWKIKQKRSEAVIVS